MAELWLNITRALKSGSTKIILRSQKNMRRSPMIPMRLTKLSINRTRASLFLKSREKTEDRRPLALSLTTADQGHSTGSPCSVSVLPSSVRYPVFTIMHSPRTKASIPLWLNVRNAIWGVFTIGSPFRLKEVLSTIGTPVAYPKFSISQ